MNNKIIFSGLGLLTVVITTAVIVMHWPETEGQETVIRHQEPEGRSQVDEQILDAALESPEEFQMQSAVKRDAPVPLIVPINRPVQLSEIEKSDQEKSLKMPVAASDLYFWKDYESLRKDEIRNPDSKENREGVVALMKARQRRVSQ